MNKRLFYVIFSVSLGLVFITGAVYSVEYETVTGQEDFVFMSTEKEVAMGKSLDKAVKKKFKPIEDQDIQKRVNAIGQRIALVCDRRDIRYHFTVIDDEEKEEPIINAFATPGGYIYIFKDMYDKMESDDEIAAILSHEIAHIVTRHAVKRMEASLGYNIAMIVASAVQTENRHELGRTYAAISTLMLSYSREDELFADKLSVKYTKKAGYNPEAVVSLLQKLWEIIRKGPEKRYVSHKSHPYLSIRISKAKQEVYGKMDFTDYINLPTRTGR